MNYPTARALAAPKPATRLPLRMKLSAYENRCAELRYHYLEAETEPAREALMATLLQVMANCAAAWPGAEMGPGHYKPPVTAARPAPRTAPAKRAARRVA